MTDIKETFVEISDALAQAHTMWDEAHPRLASNSSFLDGKFVESPSDKETRETFQNAVRSITALKEAGFTYIKIHITDAKLVSVCFYKKAVHGGYVFENGTLLLTAEGIGTHHNGIVSAEKGKWVIAEFQDGAVDPEILKQYHYYDGWYVCIHNTN